MRRAAPAGTGRAAEQRSVSVQLRFELGDAQAPRGHAILFARVGSDPNHLIATYCVVLPIQFSIGKYLPPILSGQMPIEGLAAAQAISAVPIPPMLEDVPSLAELRRLAERREDDLCEIGTVYLSDDGQRMAYAAEAAEAYAQLFAVYSAQWAESTVAAESEPGEELDIDDVVAGMLPERDRLNEMSRLVGQARYAIEGHDTHLLDEVRRSLDRLARSLPEKYRADQLVAAALRTDITGPQLAELYLQRAYKLLAEDYAQIPPIEKQIRALQMPGDSGQPGQSGQAGQTPDNT
jgi:hypothetical protein